nr:hypothetical protein CFP56_75296 [Quercus suber]
MRLSFSSSNRKHFEEPKIFAFHGVTYAQTPTMPRHVCTRRGAVTGVRSSSSSEVSRCERVSAGEGVTSRGGSERALSSASFDHSGVSASGAGSASDTLGLELMLAGAGHGRSTLDLRVWNVQLPRSVMTYGQTHLHRTTNRLFRLAMLNTSASVASTSSDSTRAYQNLLHFSRHEGLVSVTKDRKLCYYGWITRYRSTPHHLPCTVICVRFIPPSLTLSLYES